MKRKGLWYGTAGAVLLVMFVIWTHLVQVVAVQPIGVMGTDIGFAKWNTGFHQFTGVHLRLYTLTDWLGLVPICVGMLFAGMGCLQLIRRKRICKVDADILLLGLYYLLTAACYLFFEEYPINYRPILIEGRMEASYPSSTTLLVLTVMPTLCFQVKRRLQSCTLRSTIIWLSMAYSLFMVMGRLFSGVHWISDIVGAILYSAGLFLCYRAAAELCCQKNQ